MLCSGCANYGRDIANISHAVERSGIEEKLIQEGGRAMSQKDLDSALAWAKAQARSEKGRAFWRDLESAGSHNLHHLLSIEAWEVGVQPCPLVDLINVVPLTDQERLGNPPATASKPQDTPTQAAEGKPDAGPAR
jgi:hypothetical protein